MKNLSLEDIKNIFDCCIYLNESKKINSKMIEEIINSSFNSSSESNNKLLVS